MTLSNVVPRARNRLRREITQRLARRPVRMRNSEPIISFTFDDFPSSALITGGRILRDRGLAGTFFASFGLMGQIAPTGQIFTADDLIELRRQEHELGCHTFDHCHSWETAPARFEQSILRNGVALKQYSPDNAFVTFSYPISGPRYETKRRVSKYFDCCRGGGQGSNSGTADLNYLNAFFLEQSRDTPGMIEKLIQQNAEAGGWLILATHDVADQPTRFGCTPLLFEKVVDWSQHSGARILPVKDAVRQVAPGGVGRVEAGTLNEAS